MAEDERTPEEIDAEVLPGMLEEQEKYWEEVQRKKAEALAEEEAKRKEAEKKEGSDE